MAAACPNCGRPAELPRMTPEMLYFRCAFVEPPERVVRLPGGDVVFAFDGTVYAMREADWPHFEQMRAQVFPPEGAA
jgi:hypothetical protein